MAYSDDEMEEDHSMSDRQLTDKIRDLKATQTAFDMPVQNTDNVLVTVDKHYTGLNPGQSDAHEEAVLALLHNGHSSETGIGDELYPPIIRLMLGYGQISRQELIDSILNGGTDSTTGEKKEKRQLKADIESLRGKPNKTAEDFEKLRRLKVQFNRLYAETADDIGNFVVESDNEESLKESEEGEEDGHNAGPKSSLNKAPTQHNPEYMSLRKNLPDKNFKIDNEDMEDADDDDDETLQSKKKLRELHQQSKLRLATSLKTKVWVVHASPHGLTGLKITSPNPNNTDFMDCEMVLRGEIYLRGLMNVFLEQKYLRPYLPENTIRTILQNFVHVKGDTFDEMCQIPSPDVDDHSGKSEVDHSNGNREIDNKIQNILSKHECTTVDDFTEIINHFQVSALQEICQGLDISLSTTDDSSQTRKKNKSRLKNDILTYLHDWKATLALVTVPTETSSETIWERLVKICMSVNDKAMQLPKVFADGNEPGLLDNLCNPWITTKMLLPAEEGGNGNADLWCEPKVFEGTNQEKIFKTPLVMTLQTSKTNAREIDAADKLIKHMKAVQTLLHALSQQPTVSEQLKEELIRTVKFVDISASESGNNYMLTLIMPEDFIIQGTITNHDDGASSCLDSEDESDENESSDEEPYDSDSDAEDPNVVEMTNNLPASNTNSASTEDNDGTEENVAEESRDYFCVAINPRSILSLFVNLAWVTPIPGGVVVPENNVERESSNCEESDYLTETSVSSEDLDESDGSKK